MKYLILILLITSCNALTLLNNKESRVDEGFGQDDGDGDDNFSCPPNYSFVYGNSILGTNDFCVMKFEAKNVGGIATSQADLTPWVTGIDLPSAKVNCTNLGSNYDLISNQEWMTIGYEVENISSNWDSGVVGSGCLYRGNSGDITGTCGFDGPNPDFGPTSGRDVRAKLYLNSGDEVWDMSGNYQEWVDWTLGGSADTTAAICTGADINLNTVSCAGLTALDYLPNDPSLISINGVGKFYGGSGGGIIRGGTFVNLDIAGFYRLTTNAAATDSSAFAFRCVYRK
jgi:hypothetical protein